MSLDNNSEAVTVRCPVDVTSIADCWYEESAAMNPREESIAVVCCTVNLCTTPRGSPVGLESGKVPNSAISISSRYNYKLGKPKARLNSPSAWVPKDDDEDPWLQIKFNSAYVITAILTQGRADSPDQWVTSYIVSSSMDGASWTHYQDINTNTVKVYTGNYDPNSFVVHTIFKPIECRFFRIYPKTANNVHRSLRLELTGYGPLNDLIGG
ncbi:lactadherin-like [Strongylocentrotus purpuratus]|uniref:F5/8 type C domain-containing protein n=1 Tax=Strongylocentrotus purpuratus TaxID=7668 RepID=A0A7M7MZF0_STRPU|nr:lactadherin-like [Strongylocentrotus purpuratus]